MTTSLRLSLFVALLLGVSPTIARAHCDALDGPVVKAARAALEGRDVAKVMPWIGAEHAADVRDAFERTLRVRASGGDALALADTWFFETVVRLHRAGEGAPFDGLKPAGQTAPLVVAVDKTLEAGSVDALVARVSEHVSAGVREHFTRANEAQRHAADSVDAGRRFVAAYVAYMHYVEGLHQAALGAAAHGSAATTAPTGHQHQK
jgi:hypothetical protein